MHCAKFFLWWQMPSKGTHFQFCLQTCYKPVMKVNWKDHVSKVSSSIPISLCYCAILTSGINTETNLMISNDTEYFHRYFSKIPTWSSNHLRLSLSTVNIVLIHTVLKISAFLPHFQICNQLHHLPQASLQVHWHPESKLLSHEHPMLSLPAK